MTRPAAPDHGDAELRHYWELIRHGKWLIAASALFAVALGYAYVARTRPVYEASTSVLIDDAANGAMNFLDAADAGPSVSTEMLIMRSRRIAVETVDSLSLRLNLLTPGATRNAVFSSVNVGQSAPPATYRLTRVGPTSFSIGLEGGAAPLGRVEVGQVERLPGGTTIVLAPTAVRYETLRFDIVSRRAAVTNLLAGLKVSLTSQDANVVDIRYQANDPSLAASIPNAIAASYIAQRQKNKKAQATSTVDFLSAQKDTLATQLNAAEDQLGSYRAAAHVLDPIQQGAAEVSSIMSEKADQANLRVELSGLETLLKDLKSVPVASDSSISVYRRALTYPGVAANPVAANIAGSLASLSDQRATLLMRRTPADPDVLALDSRIRQQEADLGSIIQTYMLMVRSRLAARNDELAQNSADVWRTVPDAAIRFDRLNRQVQLMSQAYSMVITKLKDAQISQAVTDASAQILDNAQPPLAPISPNKPLIIAIAGLTGAMLGIIIALVRAGLDRALRTREDVQLNSGAATLGIIPAISAGIAGSATSRLRNISSALVRFLPRSRQLGGQTISDAPDVSRSPASTRLIAAIDPLNPIAEAYRTLRTNITFSHADQPYKSLVFTSPLPGDGKTTTASNFAITLAQQGLNVLLIDGDLRRGVLNTLMNIPREPGLSNNLLDLTPFEEAVHTVEMDNGISLKVLTTGTLPPNPAELLGSKQMRDLMARLAGAFDAIIIDAPPLNVVTDAAILGTIADGVILVVRSGVTTGDGLRFAVELLHNVRARIVGTVLNGVDLSRDTRYTDAYGYSYGYQYYSHQA